VVTIAEPIRAPKRKRLPDISPVMKAARVETRVSNQQEAQGELL